MTSAVHVLFVKFDSLYFCTSSCMLSSTCSIHAKKACSRSHCNITSTCDAPSGGLPDGFSHAVLESFQVYVQHLQKFRVRQTLQNQILTPQNSRFPKELLCGFPCTRFTPLHTWYVAYFTLPLFCNARRLEKDESSNIRIS